MERNLIMKLVLSVRNRTNWISNETYFANFYLLLIKLRKLYSCTPWIYFMGSKFWNYDIAINIKVSQLKYIEKQNLPCVDSVIKW